ncbi:hypothetical protein [Zoogloea sp. LCSB751]|uniref:hypothetical protein n=1 Tax=Zoogloea sp. LCSB751 TaxID=1965277 RepID=UPI0013747AC4|nr:hypothetical protein [Zoogloea sp. LCSB751]
MLLLTKRRESKRKSWFVVHFLDSSMSAEACIPRQEQMREAPPVALDYEETLGGGRDHL